MFHLIFEFQIKIILIHFFYICWKIGLNQELDCEDHREAKVNLRVLNLLRLYLHEDIDQHLMDNAMFFIRESAN